MAGFRVSVPTSQTKTRSMMRSILLGVCLLVAIGLFDLCLGLVRGDWVTFTNSFSRHDRHTYGMTAEEVCKQADPLGPTQHAHLFYHLDRLFATESFKLKAYESLGGAVRIPYALLMV